MKTDGSLEMTLMYRLVRVFGGRLCSTYISTTFIESDAFHIRLDIFN